MEIIRNKPPIGSGVGMLGSGCGGISMSCPICGNGFRRAPSHAARNNFNTCSKGCSAEMRKVRIITECASCKKPMEQTPSEAERIKTCSKLCSSLLRRGDSPKPKSTTAYKQVVERISSRAKCVSCGVEHGPWIVRGLKASFDEAGETHIDESGAELWCKHCHLKEIAPLGHVVRDAWKHAASE